MADEWFLIKAGKKVGPLSVADLRARVAAGEITSADLLWKQGMERPVSCGRVRGLLPTASTAGSQETAGSKMPPPLGEIHAGVSPASRFCAQCGKPVAVGDAFCTACGAGLAVQEKAVTAEDVAIGLVIPHKVSGLALAAGYVGLISFFCLVPAPIAILLGVLAIRDLRKHPGRQGYGRAIFGIVAGSLALAVGLLLVAVALLRS